jgi:hypothetical protein
MARHLARPKEELKACQMAKHFASPIEAPMAGSYSDGCTNGSSEGRPEGSSEERTRGSTDGELLGSSERTESSADSKTFDLSEKALIARPMVRHY